MKAVFGVLVPAFLLAGCDASPDKGDLDMKNASVAEVQEAARKVQSITPGLWTVTTEITDVRLPGVAGEGGQMGDREMADAMMQQMKGRTQTQTSCITPEQAQGPSSALIGGKADGVCSFETFSLLRGTLDAVMTCRQKDAPGQMVVATHGTYSGDTVKLESVTRIEETLGQPPEKAMRLVSRVAGRRTGDCPAGDGGSK